MRIPPFLAAGMLLVATCVAAQAATIYEYFYSGIGVPPAGLEVQGKPTTSSGDTFRSDIQNGYTQFNLLLNSLFEREGNPILLSEIASITYSTRTDTPENGLDWAVRIYTSPTATSKSDWYNLRFDGRNPVGSDGNWGHWDMDSTFDTGKNWFSVVNDGGSKDGGVNTSVNLTLSGITSNPAYAEEKLEFLAFYVGSGSNTKQLFNDIGSIRIVLTNGDEVQVNMIPEPAAFTFLAASGVAYALFRRKRLG